MPHQPASRAHRSAVMGGAVRHHVGVRVGGGIVGIALFAVLGIVVGITRQWGLLWIVATGLLGCVAILRRPDIFVATEEPAPEPKRPSILVRACAWIFGLGGLAACITSLIVDIDALLLFGVLACLAGVFFALSALERRMPPAMR